ncbi:hypothetical protein HBN82_10615 [Pseudomonas lundensis]|uniref:P-loop NTPase fold protein n=1 Tax=Pseudomonas lundensis TaxID=86185 RepID=UPI001475622C|nr:P-loop NTPase fold protein [Pseudomonas lundensis]NNA16309.1 hypothetical protein [Pseudomonas lundensis]
MNDLNFQNESPSGVDAFKGESHNRVAHAMHEYIKSKRNHRVIGLDGEFGSGKSSILQMLDKKIISEGSKSKLWIFDCEQNYQGSIKSNFIELFTDQIITLLKKQNREQDVPDVQKNRDIALGRHYSYTKDTRSHISIWAVLLIASGVLTPTFIRDYLIQLRSEHEFSIWIHGLYLMACTAPASILALAYVFSKKENDERKRWNISSLLKGSSDDRISETIEVSKEVSPLDLKRTLAKHLHIISDHHFIIVIDNLDRLPRDVLRSVWSDLEIFTSVTGTENLSVIVPFCSTKVSKYLNGDGEQSYDSKDFIAKKFPVVFRAPPIITSGWKDAFRVLWAESFGENNLADADTCSVILQRHSPMAGGLVTPRLQKRFINDIATTLLVTADKPSVVCIAAYLAICKYNGVTIEAMLKDPDAPNVDKDITTATETDDTAIAATALNMDKTKRTLKGLFGEDMKTGWPIQILQIHFQTSSDIAIAELIDQPLATAIDSLDGKKLASLIPYFGFKDSFVRGLEGTVSASNLFQSLYQASKVEGCSIADLLPHVSAKFSVGAQLKAQSAEARYFEAIKGLIILGLRKEIFAEPLAAARNAFEDMIAESYDLDSAASYRDIISTYDSYLDSMKEGFEPLTLSSAELLFHMIIPDPDLKMIDAKKIGLDTKGLTDAVLQLSSTEHANLGMVPLSEDDWQYCLQAYFGESKLSTTPRPYFLGDTSMAAIMEAIALDPTEDRLWLAAALFGKYSSAIPQLVQQHLPSVKSARIKIAMAVMYMRLDLGLPLSEIPEIEKAFKAEPEYLDTLVRATVISANLLKLTLDDDSSHLVAPILVKLIKEKAISSLASALIYENFSKYSEIMAEHDLSKDELLKWFTSFELSPDRLPVLVNLDTLFLDEILLGSNATLLKLRAELLDRSFGAGIDVETWSNIIGNATSNERIVLSYMAEEKLDFSGEASAHKAVSAFILNSIKQTPFVKPSTAAVSNSNIVLKLFDRDTRAIVGTELRAFVYDLKTDIESSIFILAEYGGLLPGISPRTLVEEERLLQILAQMNSNPDTTSIASNFIDSRAQQLAEWTISKEHKDTYASLVTKLKTRLPTIYSNLAEQHGFRTRMKALAKVFLGAD